MKAEMMIVDIFNYAFSERDLFIIGAMWLSGFAMGWTLACRSVRRNAAARMEAYKQRDQRP